MDTNILSQIITAIPSNVLPLVVTVLGLFYIYRKIENKRTETKVERDNDSQTIHDTLITHTFEISKLKGEQYHNHEIQDDIQKQVSELTTAVAKLSVSVETFSEAVKELREDIKEMRKK